MRTRLVPALAVLSLGFVLAGAGGCKAMYSAVNLFQKGDLITYEQYLSIDPEANPPLSVDDVINQLGKPMSVQDLNGARRRIDYHAYGADDDMKRAEFQFNADEKLEKKALW